MNVKLLTEHHLEFLSLNGGCTGSYEFTLVKMPHCWKSHVGSNIFIFIYFYKDNLVIPFYLRTQLVIKIILRYSKKGHICGHELKACKKSKMIKTHDFRVSC